MIRPSLTRWPSSRMICRLSSGSVEVCSPPGSSWRTPTTRSSGCGCGSAPVIAGCGLGCGRTTERTEAAIAAALTEGGVPAFEAVVAAAAVIGALTAALLEWANDPDAGPMGDAVTAALALLEVRPLR